MTVYFSQETIEARSKRHRFSNAEGKEIVNLESHIQQKYPSRIKEIINTDPAEIKRVSKNYEQVYIHKLDNLGYMDQFLKKYKL